MSEVAAGDPHAAFRVDVAERLRLDPMPTFAALSAETGVPVDDLVRYALVRWVSAGSEALLAMGPQVLADLQAVVAEAEAAGTDEARLAAYERLRGVVSWLAAGA